MTEKIELSDKEKIKLSPGELSPGEIHPSAFAAHQFICSIPRMSLMMYQESLASVALSGNRVADLCSETLRRLLSGKAVSDRYLLGLAWQLMFLEKENNAKFSEKTD